MVMIGGGLGRLPINQIIHEQFQVEEPLPYFHALVIGERNIDSVRYKILSIPGVEQVKSKSASHLQRQAKELLVDLGLEELHREEYSQGLQIFLAPRTHEQVYPLAKEYIIRLLGRTHVAMGALKRPEVTFLKTKQASIIFLHQWGYWLLISVAALFWFLSLLSITFDFKRYCYVLEEYQRRRNITPKVMLGGILCLLTISLSAFLCFERVHYHSAAIVFTFMLIFSCGICSRKRWSQ